MIRLSAEQMLALQDVEMHRFARRVIEELPSYRPETIAGRSRATVFAAVNAALERAVHYGIETERGLWLYCNISVAMGTTFDADPTLPWARDILVDPAFLGDERVDDLWNTQVDWCEEAIGEGKYWPQDVLNRLKDMGPPSGTGPLAADDDLRALWPEKAEMAGPKGRKSFIESVSRRAHDLGLTDEQAIRRFFRIAFVLGFAFDSDPLHDWAWPILQRIGTQNDNAVLDQLYEALCVAVIDPSVAKKSD